MLEHSLFQGPGLVYTCSIDLHGRLTGLWTRFTGLWTRFTELWTRFTELLTRIDQDLTRIDPQNRPRMTSHMPQLLVGPQNTFQS